MAFETTRQQLLQQAALLDRKYGKSGNQEYRDEAIRLRRIVTELEAFTGGGGSGVTQILAGTNVTVSPAGGTGIVTVNATGGGGATTLDGLSDVTISAPANGQVLTYNSTTTQWENQTPGGGGGGGDMYKSTYDVDNDGIVDGSETTQIIVRNSTGTTLTKGTVVYLSGATGNRPNAVRAKADTEATSSKTIGIVIANINNNSDGFVAVNGTLHNLDTSAYTAGDAVWLSATTAGAFTSTIPAEPNHTVFIGYIARSHPTQGRLVIAIQNGYELNELHGVLISSEANNDLLVYETSSTLWKNKSISTIFGGTPLVSVPTLAQVTTAGNTTTNFITVGGITANQSVTASGAIARGSYFNQTLVAAANNDVLVGLDISTNITAGAFTGLRSYGLRIVGDNLAFQPSTTTKIPLFVTSNNNTRLIISSTATGASFNTGFSLTQGNTFKWSLASYGTNADFVFFNDVTNTNSLFITGNTNNVLINTTTDTGHKLRVQGTVSAVLTNATHANAVYYNTTTGELTYGTAGGGATPTLAQVTTAGNTTTNGIAVGSLTIPVVVGTNRTATITAVNLGLDNFSGISIYPNSGTNVASSINVVPRGTGFSGNRGGFNTYNTDVQADPNNYELLSLRALGTYFALGTGHVGTATLRPLLLSSGFASGGTQLNTNQLWLYTSGNIGINTTTDAGFKLDVNGTTRLQGLVNGFVSLDTTNKSLIVINEGTPTPSRGLAVYQNNDGVQAAAARFFKSRGTYASPTDVGNGDLVGFFTFVPRIGGTYPTDISLFGGVMTSATGVSQIFMTGTTAGNYTPTLLIGHNGNVGIGPLGGTAITSLTLPTARLQVRGSGTTTSTTALRIENSSGTAGLIVNDAGNTLLGTTTDAGYKLDVNGTARVQGNLTVDTDTLFVDAANNRVGIGTSTPSDKFHIQNGNLLIARNDSVPYFTVQSNLLTGDGSAAFVIQSQLGNTRMKFMAYGNTLDPPSSYGIYIQAGNYNSTGNSPLYFSGYYGNTGSDLTFDFSKVMFVNGNVLIGTTTNAGYKLDVNGTARVQGNLTVDTNTLFVDATNDRVGIGTATPSYKLHIQDGSATNNGQIRGLVVENTSTWNNLTFGIATTTGKGNANAGFLVDGLIKAGFAWDRTRSFLGFNNWDYSNFDFSLRLNSNGSLSYHNSVSGGAQLFTVLVNGNTLIGTTTDTGHKLRVNGTVSAALSNVTHTNQVYYNTATGELTYGALPTTVGYTGIVTIVTNPPGQQNLDFQNGLLVNVF
jgi:hypothetical protein